MSKHIPRAATFLTLAGMVILCGLGTWQVKRLAWKTDIIEKLDAAYNGREARPLPVGDFHEGAFIYGRVSGIFRPDKALLLGPRTREGEVGKDLIVPLETRQGTILVDMGWTPWPLEKLPVYHLQNKKVWFEGLARAPDWNAFTPDNKPEENLWFKADIEEIARIKNLGNTQPFILYAEHASHKFDAAFPNNVRQYPRNAHLQYALFWFTMAGALLVIYMLRFWGKEAR